MVTHYNILAWRIPWMEKPGRLQSTGSHTVQESDTTELLHFHFPSAEPSRIDYQEGVGSD